jgi:hypothetical protein
MSKNGGLVLKSAFSSNALERRKAHAQPSGQYAGRYARYIFARIYELNLIRLKIPSVDQPNNLVSPLFPNHINGGDNQ